MKTYTIKPLKWYDEDDWSKATTFVYVYYINLFEGAFNGSRDSTDIFKSVETIEQAKAACEADWQEKVGTTLAVSDGWQTIESAPMDETPKVDG